jgi:hypothetical protein
MDFSSERAEAIAVQLVMAGSHQRHLNDSIPAPEQFSNLGKSFFFFFFFFFFLTAYEMKKAK